MGIKETGWKINVKAGVWTEILKSIINGKEVFYEFSADLLKEVVCLVSAMTVRRKYINRLV